MSGQPSAAMDGVGRGHSAGSEPCGRPLTIRSIQRVLAHDGRSSPAAVAAVAPSSSATGTWSESVTPTTLALPSAAITVCETRERGPILNVVPFALYTGQNAPR